jgi:hypothetical protein
VIYGVNRYKDYYYYINTQQDADTKVLDTANFLNRKISNFPVIASPRRIFFIYNFFLQSTILEKQGGMARWMFGYCRQIRGWLYPSGK